MLVAFPLSSHRAGRQSSAPKPESTMLKKRFFGVVSFLKRLAAVEHATALTVKFSEALSPKRKQSAAEGAFDALFRVNAAKKMNKFFFMSNGLSLRRLMLRAV